jgi:hypothetical protein
MIYSYCLAHHREIGFPTEVFLPRNDQLQLAQRLESIYWPFLVRRTKWSLLPAAFVYFPTIPANTAEADILLGVLPPADSAQTRAHYDIFQ